MLDMSSVKGDPRKPGDVFTKPVFILASPRSGSSLLFSILSSSKTFWTIGGESHGVIEGIPELRPLASGNDSNRLTADNARPAVREALKARFIKLLRDCDGRPYLEAGLTAIRMLEKTPKNALRVPFLNAVFPDALFIYLHRDPRENISSIMEAWRDGARYVSYTKLEGWDGNWSLLLPPGWRGLRGKPLERIAAYQWASANTHILDDLAQIPAHRWTSLSHADLIRDPQTQVRKLCKFAGVPFDKRMADVTSRTLPLSHSTLTPPSADKWKKNEKEIMAVLPSVEGVWRRIIQDALPAHEAALRAAPAMEGNRVAGENTRESVKHRKIGRNDSCPCGSGKKYKHCHG